MILVVCPNPSVDTYAYLPKLNLGRSNRIRKMQEFPGGKGVHVALALKELGSNVELMGIWAGATGEWVKESCKECGIEVSGIEVQGSTRKCYTFITEDDESDHTEILEPGPNLSKIDFQELLMKFKFSLKNASLVVISGSWPNDSPDDACQQFVNLANSENVKVMLDCTGIQLENALKENVFGLHLNESEHKEALNKLGKDAFDDVECLALTKGKEGLYLRYKEDSIHGKLKLDHVISTVGSGDCLTAGICLAVDKEFDVKNIAKYGVACGAANCLREDLGMLYKADFEKLLNEVQLNY